MPMTERDREVSYWEAFYAGTETADTLYEKQVEIESENSDPAVFCFSKPAERKTWYLGVYEGNSIRPLEEKNRKETVEFFNRLIERGTLKIKSAVPIESTLVTALTKEEFDRLCEENATADSEQDNENSEDSEEDVNFSMFDANSNFKRWQFAILVVGLSAFLALVFGNDDVWSDFYLLNGTFIRAKTAALLFIAWGIPLTLFNALFTVRYRNLFTMLFLSFSPLAIRRLSLLRNYSVPAMLVCVFAVLAFAILASLLERRRLKKRTVSETVEAVRNAGLMAAYVLFFAFLLIEIFIPSVRVKEVQHASASADPETQIRYVPEEDLELLNSDSWNKLPAEKQSQILLSIAEEVSDQMGIQTPSLYLETNLMGNYAAFYTDTDHSIHIWKAYLENNPAEDAVNMILHELFHAYQHSVITSSAINWDSPDIQTNAFFAQIWKWKQEDEEYIDADRWDVQIDAYYEQSLETDARDFAEIYVSNYIKQGDPITSD